MMTFTEAQLEAAIIELLEAEGYPHVSEPILTAIVKSAQAGGKDGR